MRALFLVALLASAATPALAAPRDHDRQEARAERSDNRAERQADRAERQQQRADRPQRAERPERAERPAMPDRQVQVREVRQVERVAPRDRQGGARDVRSVERVSRADSPDSVRNWRPAQQRVRTERPAVRTRDSVQDFAQRRADRQAERQNIRDRQDYMRARTPQVREPRVSRVPIQGTQPPVRESQNRYDGRNWRDGDHDRDHHRWNGDWRNDHRYDWRHYRDRNRSAFRIGFYFDPFGWNYQRYNVGWRLWPSYYSSRYWINDPYMYRLPYAPPGLQWVRYYNDALLVDTWDGQVVDVIYSFFW